MRDLGVSCVGWVGVRIVKPGIEWLANSLGGYLFLAFGELCSSGTERSVWQNAVLCKFIYFARGVEGAPL